MKRYEFGAKIVQAILMKNSSNDGSAPIYYQGLRQINNTVRIICIFDCTIFIYVYDGMNLAPKQCE